MIPPITIAQTITADCYLLASLDCIFSAGTEALLKIKSLFMETDSGITLRIKHSKLSENLKPHCLRKYGYFHDITTNEDVFFLSRDILQEIDTSSYSVKSNALAVKILERISSYYYLGHWSDNDINANIWAHNEVKNRYKGTSTAFVGTLLGIPIQDINDLDQIIKIKTIAPQQPIYVSMMYQKKDEEKCIRHALRIERIEPKDGSFYFMLINPWDTRKAVEIYSMADIKTKNPRFCIYITDEQKKTLIRIASNLSEDYGQWIFSDSQLLDMMTNIDNIVFSKLTKQNIKEDKRLFSESIITKIHSGDLVEVILSEPYLIQQCLCEAQQNKQRLIQLLFEKIHCPILLTIIVKNQLGPLSFETMQTEEIELAKVALLDKLQKLLKAYVKQPHIKSFYEETVLAINATADLRKQAIRQKAYHEERAALLTTIDFTGHLHKLQAKIQNMDVLVKSNKNYVEAILVASTLHEELLAAKNDFLCLDQETNDTCTKQFVMVCKQAIDKAKPVLEQHRGWVKFFYTLTRMLLSILTFSVMDLSSNTFSFFAIKTDCAKKLDDFELAIQALT